MVYVDDLFDEVVDVALSEQICLRRLFVEYHVEVGLLMLFGSLVVRTTSHSRC